MQNVRNLAVWRIAIDVADAVYDLSTRLPRDERFGVTRQLRRAAVSVAANIAEGAGRSSDRDFRRFLLIAIGSLEEACTYVELAYRRDWLDREAESAIRALTDKLRAKLLQLIKRIEKDIRSATKPEA